MTSIVVAMMNEDEARRCVEQIRVGIEGIRALVLDLSEREGWRALGYDSWRECVTAEFGQSQRHLYRLLTAAQIERDLPNWTNDPLPESHLRELARLPDPETRRAAWQEVTQEHGDALTAAKVRAVVERYRGPAPEERTLGECEAIISVGVEVFVQTTEAFAQIYRERLFRPAYATFEQYCRARHNLDATFVLDAMDILDMMRPAA